MDYSALARSLVSSCLKKGADEAEAYLESSRSLTVEVRDGDVETIQEASGAGVGVRVLVRGRMAFASSNDLRPKALEDVAARAVVFARTSTADPNNVLPDDPGSTDVPGLYDPEIAGISLEEKIELAKRLEDCARRDPRTTRSAGAAYREQAEEVFLANSHGLRKSRKSTSCSCDVSIVVEKGDEKSRGGDSCGRRFYADLKPVREIAAKAVDDAVGMLDPRPVKTQRAAVVFDPDAASAVLGGLLAAVNGERVLQGASFLGGRLGQPVASRLVTVIDDGTRPKGPGSAPFDGEGVPTGTRLVVDQGVLGAYLYNSAVARRAGVRSTGNAVRSGFSSLPAIGAHNFFMAAGEAKPEDIIRATVKGLWLKEVTGYGINPVDGNFSGGASGFWIENGKVAFPVKGLTIAATAEEMLKGIDMVADDLDLARAMTAPTFRIRLMQIGGE
jgi:PmbA protein